MLDKITFALAYYGLFTPLRLIATVINRLSLALFLLGLWFVSPWARLVDPAAIRTVTGKD